MMTFALSFPNIFTIVISVTAVLAVMLAVPRSVVCGSWILHLLCVAAHASLLVSEHRVVGGGVPEPLPVWGGFLSASYVSMILCYDSFFFQNSVICPCVFYLTPQRGSLTFILLSLACTFWSKCGWLFLRPWSSRISPAVFLGAELLSFFFCLGPGLICRCRSPFSSELFILLFYSIFILLFLWMPRLDPVLLFLFQWPGLQNAGAPLRVLQSCPASLSSHSWSLCPFLSRLLKFRSIQWPVKGVFIQIGQYLTHLLPSSSCKLTFVLCTFIKDEFHSPPPTPILTQGEVYLWTPSTTVTTREMHESAAAADCGRSGTAVSSLSCIFIVHLASDLQSTARRRIGSWFSASKYRPDALFLMLALQPASLAEARIRKALAVYSLAI